MTFPLTTWYPPTSSVRLWTRSAAAAIYLTPHSPTPASGLGLTYPRVPHRPRSPTSRKSPNPQPSASHSLPGPPHTPPCPDDFPQSSIIITPLQPPSVPNKSPPHDGLSSAPQGPLSSWNSWIKPRNWNDWLHFKLMISSCELTLSADWQTAIFLELVCFPISQGYYFIVSLLSSDLLVIFCTMMFSWRPHFIMLLKIMHKIRSRVTLFPTAALPACTHTQLSPLLCLLGPSVEWVSFLPQNTIPPGMLFQPCSVCSHHSSLTTRALATKHKLAQYLPSYKTKTFLNSTYHSDTCLFLSL